MLTIPSSPLQPSLPLPPRSGEEGPGAEDFGLLANLAPGAMFDLGAHGEDGPRKGHGPTFDIDERCLPLGASILAEAARRYPMTEG